MPAASPPVLHREKLSVPPAWWVLAGLFALSLLLAFFFYLGPLWGFGTAVVSLGVAAALFQRAAVVIEVTGRRFQVGRAAIDLGYLGAVTSLDAVAARARRGPQADARAYLVLRPYVATAVEVTLTDADDPAPYWLVASRRPVALAAALNRAVAAAEPIGSGPAR